MGDPEQTDPALASPALRGIATAAAPAARARTIPVTLAASLKRLDSRLDRAAVLNTSGDRSLVDLDIVRVVHPIGLNERADDERTPVVVGHDVTRLGTMSTIRHWMTFRLRK
jgi:hypothetical protein